jgi:hypothetical protein
MTFSTWSSVVSSRATSRIATSRDADGLIVTTLLAGAGGGDVKWSTASTAIPSMAAIATGAQADEGAAVGGGGGGGGGSGGGGGGGAGASPASGEGSGWVTRHYYHAEAGAQSADSATIIG